MQAVIIVLIERVRVLIPYLTLEPVQMLKLLAASLVSGFLRVVGPAPQSLPISNVPAMVPRHPIQ